MEPGDYIELLQMVQKIEALQQEQIEKLNSAFAELPNVKLQDNYRLYVAVDAIKDDLTMCVTAQNRILGTLSIIEKRLDNIIKESKTE